MTIKKRFNFHSQYGFLNYACIKLFLLLFANLKLTQVMGPNQFVEKFQLFRNNSSIISVVFFDKYIDSISFVNTFTEEY